MPKIESTENMLYTLLGRKMTDDELLLNRICRKG